MLQEIIYKDLDTILLALFENLTIGSTCLNKEHDTIATRLAIILTKLNSGESFSIEELVEEFGVTARTLQRDLNDRLSYLPIKKKGNYYYLEEYYLGKLNFEDIKQFAVLSGIKELYPTLQESFLKDILDAKTHQAYLIKGHNYEDLSTKTDDFKLLESAILDKLQVKFIYSDKPRVVNPYKLLNSKGIWYLVGEEDTTLKTFGIAKITQLEATHSAFEQKEEILATIKNDDNIWFSQTHVEVLLSVDKEVAAYFARRKILPNQTIVEETNDHLIVSTKVAFDEDILKIVRYWIPHVKIISPLHLQEKLEESLKKYLNL